MLWVAPLAFLRRHERVGDGAERRLSRVDYCRLSLGFYRVFPRLKHFAGFMRLIARLGERNHVRRSEPGFRNLAGEGEAINPFPGAAGDLSALTTAKTSFRHCAAAMEVIQNLQSKSMMQFTRCCDCFSG
jgi:hypothetical protein